MNNENTKKLLKKYPELYRGHTKPPNESLMCFLFECGDGWYNMIDELSDRITKLCKKKDIEIPEVFQVKSKWAELRYYLDFHADDEIDTIIDEYEYKSSKICEKCGKPGEIYRAGWCICYCEDCKKELLDGLKETNI